MSTGLRNPAVTTALAILLFHGGGLARADGVDIATDVYIGTISNYYRNAGDSAGFDTFYVTAELNLYPSMKPYHAGLFVDYRDSSSNRLNDNVNLGGYFRLNLARWDTTTWLFVNRSPRSAGTLVYAARVRYRIADDYKLGVEALAPVEDAGKPTLMGGLYGSVTESLSFRALAGAGVRSGPDFAARLELLWQIH